MEEPPGYDEDDLINDYAEDFDEPPPQEDFDEAMLEEAMATEVTDSANSKKDAVAATTTSSSQPVAPAPEKGIAVNATTATTTITTTTDTELAMDVDDASATVREAFSLEQNKPDLYSFDRYQENKDWRADKVESPGSKVMKAKEWKAAKKSKDQMSLWEDDEDGPSMGIQQRVKTVAPSAPDAQLLQYLERSTCQTSKCRMARHPIPGKSCLPITLGDGTRVYATVHTVTQARSRGQTRHPHVHALGVSMDVLMARVQALLRKKEHLKNTTVVASPTSVADDAVLDESDFQLWVDKHAPSSFAHLLSDERSNREVVRALRAWDPYVFHKEPPKRPEFQQKFEKEHKEVTPSLNPKDKRPEECNRVILLSGPPGVGKTTLAHIVARHAGYRPIEVNGSDERSESALKDRVVRAMESTTLNFGQNSSKPNCLILDEIDGADAGKAIQSLVDIIRAEIPSKLTKTKIPYLRRPIIFICNNKFAPALKPLLPFCRQFNVHAPTSSRLVARLRSVLTTESMSVFGGSSLLNQLVTAAGGDIRACLYTLQFASARAKVIAGCCVKGTTIDISLALKSALDGSGLKDVRNDVAGTVSKIFRKDKSKQYSKSNSGGSSMDKVLRAVDSFGDNSRILDCLFLNVPRVSYIDPTFDRCYAAHEWLSSADLYRSQKTSETDYAMEYLHIPSATAAIHLLCRVEQRQDLTYSTRDLADARYQKEANVALSQKFAEGLSLQAQGARGRNQVATETVPYALWVLAAGQGSSALTRATTSENLLSEGERLAFEHHASTLRSLGLSYVAEQGETGYGKTSHSHGSQRIRLEPPIEGLVQFSGIQNERQDIPPAMKEMLSRRALHDRMRERGLKETPTPKSRPTTATMDVDMQDVSAAAPVRNPAAKDPSKSSASKSPPPVKRAAPLKKIAPPAKRSKQAGNFLTMGAKQAKAAKSARTAARVGTAKFKKTKLSNTGSEVPLDQVVRLKYVKGFTQAVSTPCCLEDLLAES